MHIERIHSMLETLTKCAESQLDKGAENVDAEEMGEVIDMIKDLSEAEYKCTVVKAMKDAEEDDELKESIMELTSGEEMRYYNRNRYASGRYAPSGYGNRTRRGYDEGMAPVDFERYYQPRIEMMEDRMYYGGGSSNRSGGYGNYGSRGNSGDGNMGNQGGNMRGYDGGNYGNTMGQSNRGYDMGMRQQQSESQYDRAKRSYMETKEMHGTNNPEDKQARMATIEEMIHAITDDTMDIVKEASPEEKALLKNKFNVLMTKIQ